MERAADGATLCPFDGGHFVAYAERVAVDDTNLDTVTERRLTEKVVRG